MGRIEKAKHYIGIMLLLKDENLLSMVLHLQFMTAITRGCNLSDSEFEKLLIWCESNIDLDVSSLYIDWKKQ